MTVKQLIKKYGEGKGEATMWKSVDIISDVLDEKLSPEEMECLEKKMYAMMQGKHYDEHFAKKQVEQMFYTDGKGEAHYAPYWTDDAVKQVFSVYKNKIAGDYNFWDFYVTMNMVMSDNINLYLGWWPDADDAVLTQKFAEAAVNWLNDEDSPQGDCRVWKYFNG